VGAYDAANLLDALVGYAEELCRSRQRTHSGQFACSGSGSLPGQTISVLTQGLVHTPTRAVAEAIIRYQNDRSEGREAALWRDLGQSLASAYKTRFASVQSALYATRAAFAGPRGSPQRRPADVQHSRH